MSDRIIVYVVPVKSKVEISQNFVAFSEYMNFIFSKTKSNVNQVVSFHWNMKFDSETILPHRMDCLPYYILL